MNAAGYNTIHERYVGSGIVKLSHLREHPHPDPFHHLDPDCINQQKQLKEAFRDRICEPWLPEHRLKAEMSVDALETCMIMDLKRLEDDIVYPCLQFASDANINIVEGIPFLMFARSLIDERMWRTFGTEDPDERWWVIDFFRDSKSLLVGYRVPKLTCSSLDGSNYKKARLRSQYRAALTIVHAAISEPGTSELPYMPSLKPYLNSDIRLVCRTTALITSMRPLLNLESLWIAKSLTYFTCMRRSWCIEVSLNQNQLTILNYHLTNAIKACRNYLDVMRSQWVDITLDWKAEVVHAMDPESIAKLQSRAPLTSSEDMEFIVQLFESNTFLPKLTNRQDREAVQKAICRCWYPILTFQTFWEDVKLLTSRIDNPMKEFLGNDRKRNKRTLQQRVQEYFQLVTPRTKQTESHSQQYYEILFLYLMRTATPGTLISKAQMNDLAERVFKGERDGGEDVTMTSDSSDEGHLDVNKRHGKGLFRNPTAVRMLYHDVIRGPCFPGTTITPTFMARFIVCVFLFGAPPSSEISPTTASSGTEPAMSATSTIRRLPFGDDTSITSTTRSHGASSGIWTNGWSESQWVSGDVSHIPQVITNAIGVDSVSIVGSAATLVYEDTSADIWKPRPSSWENIDIARWAKERSRYASSPVGSNATMTRPSQGEQVPKRTAPLSYESLSLSSNILGTSDVQSSSGGSWSDKPLVATLKRPRDDHLANAVSPSMYSGPGESEEYEPVETHHTLGSEALAREYKKHINQSVYEPERPQYSGAETFCGLPDLDDDTPRASPLHETPLTTRPFRLTEQPKGAPSAHTIRSFVTFQSTRNEKLRLDATRDERSIHGFVSIQMALRPDTKISYRAGGAMKAYSADDDLYLEIKKHAVEVVFVDSDLLVGTEYRLPPSGQS
jgi:hypothetical protein